MPRSSSVDNLVTSTPEVYTRREFRRQEHGQEARRQEPQLRDPLLARTEPKRYDYWSRTEGRVGGLRRSLAQVLADLFSSFTSVSGL